MRRIYKKIAALLIAFAMVISLVGTAGVSTVSAAKKGSKKTAVTVKNAKKGMKITSGNYVYKITSLSKKNSTVCVTGLTKSAKKKLTKLTIPKVLKIKSNKGKNKGTYSYKVTAIANNAFKNNKKITTVKVGDNVETIGKNAFAGCTKLKKVTLSKSVKNIKEAAFANDKNLVEVVVPKNSNLETIAKNAFKDCTKLTKFNFDNANKIKSIDDNAFINTKIDEDTIEDAKDKTEENKYTYEVIPLMSPFNSYFYIKTDNPDPDSFRFVDTDSKYTEDSTNGNIRVCSTYFADVKYVNEETKSIKGGYIGVGTNTDGGDLKLQTAKVTGTYNVHNISTGEVTTEKKYEFTDTDVTVKVPEVKNVVDYLISTYGDSSKSYFDNLSGIQSGFSSVCLYSGAYVLGVQKKSDKVPNYGLSTSPHVDQDLYIQSPYYREDSKSMFVSALYPMRYDSIGFPSIMGSVAKKLDSSATVEWSSSAHYIINVTYNGVTKRYGGAGLGGGQGINANQVKYWYSFDGSADDAYSKCTLKDVAAMNNEYGAMEVPEEPTDIPKLTWASVRNTVGKDGAYVKLVLINSIFGGSSEGFSYLYDNGSTSEGWGSQASGAVGYISNAWFDGRYFNKWEHYYPGAKFEDTVEQVQPALIFKDVTIKVPMEEGKKYYYNYSPIEKSDKYDPETGLWKGMMTYYYDTESKTWKANILNSVTYWDKEQWNYINITDQDYIDACTITMEEALAMKLDANTDVGPTSYYIYDRVSEPGTYHSGN